MASNHMSLRNAKSQAAWGPKNFGSLNGQADPSASISVGQFVVRSLAGNNHMASSQADVAKIIFTSFAHDEAMKQF